MVSPITTQPTAYYTRESFFDDERMAGTVAKWQETNAEAKKNTGNLLQSSLDNVSDSEKSSQVAPSLSFDELLDIINPLQHLPIVTDLYQSMTGDTMSPVAKIAGGALYGGAIGGITSIISAAMDEHGGDDGAVSQSIASLDANISASYNAIEDNERSAGLNKMREAIEDIKTVDNQVQTIHRDDIIWNS